MASCSVGFGFLAVVPKILFIVELFNYVVELKQRSTRVIAGGKQNTKVGRNKVFFVLGVD